MHDDLVAHELAHQWFGDLLTCKDWSPPLAQRGKLLASYFTILSMPSTNAVRMPFASALDGAALKSISTATTPTVGRSSSLGTSRR